MTASIHPCAVCVRAQVRADTLDLMRRLKTKLVTLTSTTQTVRRSVTSSPHARVRRICVSRNTQCVLPVSCFIINSHAHAHATHMHRVTLVYILLTIPEAL